MSLTCQLGFSRDLTGQSLQHPSEKMRQGQPVERRPEERQLALDIIRFSHRASLSFVHGDWVFHK